MEAHGALRDSGSEKFSRLQMYAFQSKGVKQKRLVVAVTRSSTSVTFALQAA
jgi:hypothetical protein